MKMIWKEVFPDYAVKQAFHESDLERGDEQVVLAMQSDLITRILTNLLKPALLHCAHNRRKFINEKDIAVAKSICIFEYKEKPERAGYLLNMHEFSMMVFEHISMLVYYLQKHMDDLQFEKEYKISNETMMYLQQTVEGCIRGFVSYMGSTSNRVTFRLFENTMGKIFKDPSYVICDQTYIPCD